MDFQQILIMVVTIAGWVLMLGSLGFGVFIIARVYKSRDKAAAAERDRLEAAAKEAKKRAKKGLAPDAAPAPVEEPKKKKEELPAPRKVVSKQAMKGFAAPDRGDVVRRLAQTVSEAQSTASASDLLSDAMNDFDVAKKEATGETETPAAPAAPTLPKPGVNAPPPKLKGFPPPPKRL